MSRTINIFLVTVCLLLFASSFTLAATINVPADHATIQAAVLASADGDTVLVAPGTYIENINMSGRSILLVSSGGSAVTTLQAVGAGSAAITCNSGESFNTIIRGFTIVGNNSARGVRCTSTSPIVEYCEVRNCGGVSDGAGFYCTNSSAKIRYNVIHSNAAGGTGSGICVEGSSSPGVEIHHNEIYNSLGTGEAIGCLYVTAVSIHNNILRTNTINHWAASGVYMNGGSGQEIINNTIVGNTHGIVTFASPQPLVQNNIIVGNTFEALPSGLTQSDYNNVWNNGSNNLPGPNGISADPLFVDAVNFDYQLLAGSPCIDAGNPDAQYNDADGTRNDMGAYSTYNPTSLPLAIDLVVAPNSNGAVNSLTPTFIWSYLDTGLTTQSEYWIQVGEDDDWSVAETWDSGPVTSSDTAVVLGSAPLQDGVGYWVRVRVSNGSQWGEWTGTSFATRVSRVIRVPLHHATIQAAINAAYASDTVLVAAGIYTENVNLSGKGIVLLSEQGSGVTTIRSALSSYAVIRCISGEGQTTIVDGFSIDGNGFSRGVHISASSPIIQNCDIFNCGNVNDGGGVYCVASSAAIRNNVIHDNDVPATGSGICVRDASIPGVEISGNEIYNSMGSGEAIGLLYVTNVYIHHNVIRDNTINFWAASGVYMNDASGVRVINNTFVNNTRGIYVFSANSPNIRNNIIVGSTYEALPTGLTNSDFNCVYENGSNNDPGPNGISADPMFLDPGSLQYALQPGSPCLNAGDPDPQYNDPDGTRNDIGAFSGEPHDPYIMNFDLPGEERSHVITATPQFSWSFSTAGTRTQDSLEIQVGIDNNWVLAESWEPGIMPFNQTSILYQGSALVRGETYYLRIRIHDGVDWSAWAHSIFRLNSIPTVPAPQSPQNQVVSTNQPWTVFSRSTDSESDPLTYHVAIYSDSLGMALVDSGSVAGPSGAGTSSRQVSIPLQENGHYWWRVRTTDGYEYSDWSQMVDFAVNVANDPPYIPVLESPLASAGDIAYSLLPLMTWLPGTDPDPLDNLTYKFELSIKSNFSIVYTRDSLTVNSFVMDDSLSLDTHYWWRVTVRDYAGLTATSVAGDFWTWKLGDLNGSRTVDLTDLSTMIAYLTMVNRPEITPRLAGDLNGDCRIDLSDLSTLIAYMTISGVELQIGCE
ncbi:MAG: right-handed parallel beta-helix repeat-containing protein [bacterium]|nr:right-handed parallel beta-helix repeat-containing protein [bacterium]